MTTNANGTVADHVLAALRTALGDEGLGTDDDFFAEGGDSVAAVHALQLIQQSTGVQLPVAVFFTNPTANLLAELVAGGSETGA
jgi:Phosphopantetheine attachment site